MVRARYSSKQPFVSARISILVGVEVDVSTSRFIHPSTDRLFFIIRQRLIRRLGRGPTASRCLLFSSTRSSPFTDDHFSNWEIFTICKEKGGTAKRSCLLHVNVCSEEQCGKSQTIASRLVAVCLPREEGERRRENERAALGAEGRGKPGPHVCEGSGLPYREHRVPADPKTPASYKMD